MEEEEEEEERSSSFLSLLAAALRFFSSSSAFVFSADASVVTRCFAFDRLENVRFDGSLIMNVDGSKQDTCV